VLKIYVHKKAKFLIKISGCFFNFHDLKKKSWRRQSLSSKVPNFLDKLYNIGFKSNNSVERNLTIKKQTTNNGKKYLTSGVHRQPVHIVA
jgi:hypothetical protein